MRRPPEFLRDRLSPLGELNILFGKTRDRFSNNLNGTENIVFRIGKQVFYVIEKPVKLFHYFIESGNAGDNSAVLFPLLFFVQFVENGKAVAL